MMLISQYQWAVMWDVLLLEERFDDNWGLDDPTGKSDDDFKTVIQRIEENIIELKKRLSENK